MAIKLKKITADAKIDVSGLQCPITGLTAAKVLLNLETDQVLEIKSNSQSIEEPMRVLAERTGNELIGFSKGNGISCSYIKKTKPLLDR